MKYSELEAHLLFFDSASKDYEEYIKDTSENDPECAGFISGDLHETREILMHGLSDSKENFESVTKFLYKYCPNSFSLMMANLDSRPDDYETLYDLCRDVNVRKEDNFEFPVDCLKKIKIYNIRRAQMTLLEYLLEHFKICWKQRATAPIPRFNEEKINIFSFNHDTNDPLRDKNCEAYIQDEYIIIDWLCQEAWYSDLSGMKDELTRWAKYWVNQYKREINSDIEIEAVQIKVKVADRDGFNRDSFILKI